MRVKKEPEFYFLVESHKHWLYRYELHVWFDKNEDGARRDLVIWTYTFTVAGAMRKARRACWWYKHSPFRKMANKRKFERGGTL